MKNKEETTVEIPDKIQYHCGNSARFTCSGLKRSTEIPENMVGIEEISPIIHKKIIPKIFISKVFHHCELTNKNVRVNPWLMPFLSNITTITIMENVLAK